MYWQRLVKLCAAISTSVLDLVFPRSCALCRSVPAPEHLYLCWECRARLPLITAPFCQICGNPAVMSESMTSFICTRCRQHQPFFDQARAIMRYEGLTRDLIQAFKYRHALWLRHDFYLMLSAGFDTYYQAHEFDAITFVPLSFTKARARTFNQARILALGIKQTKRHLPVVSALYRVRETTSQTHLTAPQRIANVTGVFKAKNNAKITGRKWLLLDDVMTTGATVNECARVLKQAGATQVCVLTLAHG